MAVFAVSWQTTTIALVGIVARIPVGTRRAPGFGKRSASNLGVLPVADLSIRWVLAVALGPLVAANLLAVAPATVASRLRPENVRKPE